MRNYVIFLLLLLAFGARPALAQSATPLPAAARTYTRDDTIRAIQQLYASRRRGGRRWCYVSVAGLLSVVRVLVASSTTTTNTYGGYGTTTTREVDGGAVALVGSVCVGLPVAVGVSKLVRFSDAQEARAIDAYVATRRPPHGFGRRLRRKDFR